MPNGSASELEGRHLCELCFLTMTREEEENRGRGEMNAGSLWSLGRSKGIKELQEGGPRATGKVQ